MIKCKQKFCRGLSFPRSAGFCLLVVLFTPALAGCIHFVYRSGMRKFTVPAEIHAQTLPVFALYPAEKKIDQNTWLNLPATAESFSAQNLEIEIIRLVNDLRAENSKPPLRHLATLDGVARSHSQEMARLNFFAHQSPSRENRSVEDRLANVGLDYTVLAENIAKEPLVRAFWSDGRVDYFTWGEVAQNAIRHWFASIGHRRNMLRHDVEELGVGAALDPSQGPAPYVYITQTFRTP